MFITPAIHSLSLRTPPDPVDFVLLDPPPAGRKGDPIHRRRNYVHTEPYSSRSWLASISSSSQEVACATDSRGLNGMDDLSRSSPVTSLLWNHATPNIFDPVTVAAMEGFYREIHVFFDGVNALPGLAPPQVRGGRLGEVPRAGLQAGCASTSNAISSLVHKAILAMPRKHSSIWDSFHFAVRLQ